MDVTEIRLLEILYTAYISSKSFQGETVEIASVPISIFVERAVTKDSQP